MTNLIFSVKPNEVRECLLSLISSLYQLLAFPYKYKPVASGRAGGARTRSQFFADLLTLSQPRGGGGHILPTITEVAAKIFPWLRPCYVHLHFT